MFAKLFGLGKKGQRYNEVAVETGAPKDWSFLVTDMHSHIIPGIDDGAQTVEDSIMLIERMMEMGFKNIITTPHIKSDHYPNTVATIQQGLHILQHALAERNMDFSVKAAAEYYIDEHFLELLERKELMPVKNNEVLVEISFLFEPARLHNILFDIQSSGYRPILAHPERYAYYHSNIDAYRELKNRGCLLQLNTIALTGYYGKVVKETAENLLKLGLYDYCGSDMHHLRHADTLKKLLHQSVYNSLRKYPFLNAKLSD